MSVVDFAQGFGAVQLAASVPTDGAPVGTFFHEHELASETFQYYSIYVNNPEEALSVTLAWFDPPSSVSAYNVSFFFFFSVADYLGGGEVARGVCKYRYIYIMAGARIYYEAESLW